MRKFNWLFLVLFSFSFLACDKEDDVELDTTDPTITITSPTAAATLAPGDVVELRAEIRDNMGLEQVKVSIADPSGTVREVNDQSINDFLNNNKEKDLDIDITLDANAPLGSYTITVVAIDLQKNEASQSVAVSVAE